MRSCISAGTKTGASFFRRDRSFYYRFFILMGTVALQNMITYSVNVADNVMLGAYSQNALSGAAAVNQIQFILQTFTISGLGDGLVVLASQYWGKRKSEPIRQLTQIALIFGAVVGLGLFLWASIAPQSLLALFTNDPSVQEEGLAYLSIIRFTYLPFIVTNILLMSLRSTEIVKIAFRLSLVTLCLNVGINYTLIYGHFGFPAMGIRGAAIGTLCARCVELLIMLLFCSFAKLPVKMSPKDFISLPSASLMRRFATVSLPCVVSSLLFSGAVAMQTAILGHISADAIAANSAATTLFQYLKMLAVSAASASCVIIGQAIGGKLTKQLHQTVHTLQLLFFGIGLVTCITLLCLKTPILSFYDLTPNAYKYASQFLTILAFVSMGTSYEMPCQCGIIRGGGDTRYVMFSDFIYSWLIVVPLSLAAAFIWHLPVYAVVICLNCDQIIKCITVGYKTNRYTWIRNLS